MNAANEVPKVRELKTLPHPGELYFNVGEVRAKALPKICGFGQSFLGVPQKPFDTVGDDNGGPPMGTKFGVGQLVWSSVLTAQPDPSLAQAAKKELLQWARADAMKRFKPDQSGIYWTVYQMMPGMLASYQRLNEMAMLNDEERKLIYSWFERLIKRVYIGEELPAGKAGYKGRQQRINNHNGRRNLVALLWAVETNNPKKFNAAIRNGYLRFLQNIRADGSIEDANRGIWAMRYTSYHISAALFIAEAACLDCWIATALPNPVQEYALHPLLVRFQDRLPETLGSSAIVHDGQRLWDSRH